MLYINLTAKVKKVDGEDIEEDVVEEYLRDFLGGQGDFEVDGEEEGTSLYEIVEIAPFVKAEFPDKEK